MKRYSFTDVESCNMCGFSESSRFKTLGLRLNGSQGLYPRKRRGIAVTLSKCPNCRLIFPNPLPKPGSLSDHYGIPPDSYWKDHYFALTEDYFARESRVARELTGLHEGGRALDIGAGVGKAMTALQSRGWDVFGIEPSAPFYENAIRRMRIDDSRLFNTSVEEATFEAESFDFVTFGAVLEHLYDPADAIGRALKWLKPTGVIQLEVPSSDYLWHKILNGYYRATGSSYVANLSPMHPPYHIYEFSLDSFRLLGRRSGFEVRAHWYEVASGRFIPGSLYWFLRPLMHHTDTGMQLTVYLGKTRSDTRSDRA